MLQSTGHVICFLNLDFPHGLRTPCTVLIFPQFGKFRLIDIVYDIFVAGEWTTALSRKEKKLRGRKDDSRAGAAAAAVGGVVGYEDDWPDTPAVATPAVPDPPAPAQTPAPAEPAAAAAASAAQDTQDTKKDSAPMEQRLSKKERKKKVGSYVVNCKMKTSQCLWKLFVA